MQQHKAAENEPTSTTFTGCLHCKRPLTHGEITEMWCDACLRDTTPTQVKNGRRS